MIDETVSHYRIVEPLGSGGMGVVYRAVDERLGREVALKFLPPALAEDPEALARFDREARLTSSLNHPNICTVHDIDQHEGRPFIVMELCFGRTVKQWLEEGPAELDQVLDVAIQTTEALDAAHRRGIVHRDIKPANLFLTTDGQVKVLDFGLAKLVSGGPATRAQGSGPTQVTGDHVTASGIAIGTIAYMSPEQALGQPLDPRSDLFSLGAVIYEMATGERAFQGASAAVVFDRILNHAPTPARMINPAVPSELDHVVSRLLSIDRNERPQEASELLHDLRRVKQQLHAPREHTTTQTGRARPAPGARARWWLPISALAVVSIVIALVAIRFLEGGPPALTTRDALLLADFQNHTGEQVFDGTLSQALAVQFAQSPYLNIVPEDRVRETLRLMGRQPNERPTGEVAREACQRLGLKAMVGGSISRLGTLYVLLVDATNCATAEPLAREQGSAERQEQVLETLGRMTSALRGRLGESLKSVEQFDVPIVQATTPSLEALRAYTLGVAQRARGAELESIPLLERALHLDPRFAAAATTLSTVYGNLGESARSREYATRAYENREHVSERERLFIDYQFHDRVSGNQLVVADTLDVWKRTYPNDFRPANLLAVLNNRLGRFDRAVTEGREALERSPGHPFPLSNLAYAYRGLGQFAKARTTAEQAVALGVETVPTRRLLYQLAVLDGDAEAAARHVAWAKGKTREFDLISAQAQVALYGGRIREATELYRASIDLAERRGLNEAASAYRAHLAFANALYGYDDRARTLARIALAPRPQGESHATVIPLFRAVVALCLLDAPEASPALRSADERYPQSTFVQEILLPAARAAAELARGRASAALEPLRAAAPYETGTVAALLPVYLRGQAHLARKSGAEALEQFQRILDHRGSDPFSPVCALAPLGIARAWAVLGDRDKSARAYAEFLAGWQHADAGIPVLIAARREAGRLGDRSH